MLSLCHLESPHFIYRGTNVGILTVWNSSVLIVYLRTGEKPQSKLCDPPGTLWNGPRQNLHLSSHCQYPLLLLVSQRSVSGPKELTSVQRECQVVCEKFLISPLPKKKKKFTLANGYRFPWGRLGELLYCVIVAAFQAPCRSGPSSVFHGDLDYELAYTWELKYGSMTVLMSKRPYWLQI